LLSALRLDPQSELHEGDARPAKRHDGVNGPSDGEFLSDDAASELTDEKSLLLLSTEEFDFRECCGSISSGGLSSRTGEPDVDIIQLMRR
jgi:hypothetical protein